MTHLLTNPLDLYHHPHSIVLGTPESLLREEVARLRAQLGECRGEVERERRIRSEAELEKEHFRAQMHRLAMALKRERERSAASARQDLVNIHHLPCLYSLYQQPNTPTASE